MLAAQTLFRTRVRTTLEPYPLIWKPLNFLRRVNNLGFDAPILLLKTLYYSRFGNIVVYPKTQISGARWLSISGKLAVGKPIRLMTHPSDKTMLELHGELCTQGNVAIGQGCRIWVGEGARCVLSDCYISANTLGFIRHGLTIGARSAISWGCQFLDDDWNTVSYAEKRLKPAEITIGEHVWIGSNVSILKGVTVGDGCVVASGSVLTRSYPAASLIGGNPGRVLKSGIQWGDETPTL